MDLFYSADYVYEGASIDTTKKARWVAESLIGAPIPGVRVIPPTVDLMPEMVERVHGANYAAAIRLGTPRQLADRNGVCSWTPEFARSRLVSTSGVISAAVSALDSGGVSGSMSSGLHHARRDHGSGFCTLNGLAIAAHEAVARGAGRVLIIDFDAHGGGGTASLIAGCGAIEQIDVAVNSFDGYRSSDGARYWLCGGRDYLATIAGALESVRNPESIDLVLYNAGVDPHEDCSVGGVVGVTDEVLRLRDRMLFEWAGACGVPVAFVFAGGYVGSRMSRHRLVGLHRQTIEEATRICSNGCV